jgi:leucyl-tRNA synthetase
VEIGPKVKMSKSKRNVVDPQKLIDQYGADTVRLFCLFASPPEMDLEWSEQGVQGAFRFLNRVWRLAVELDQLVKDIPSADDTAEIPAIVKDVYRKIHQTIKKVTNDVEDRFHFNTAISAIMELTNMIYKAKDGVSDDDAAALAVLKRGLETIVVLLHPFVPHITEEIWRNLGNAESLVGHPWLDFSEEAAAEETVTIVLQVNGKVRSRFEAPVDLGQSEMEKAALEDEKVRQWITDKTVRKVVVVPRKLVNVVVS